jgi:hypothetical protein
VSSAGVLAGVSFQEADEAAKIELTYSTTASISRMGQPLETLIVCIIQVKLKAELGVEVCDSPFPSIITIAVNEKWTRDPFARVIVSHAKANGLSPLISADEAIRKNYIKTVW